MSGSPKIVDIGCGVVLLGIVASFLGAPLWACWMFVWVTAILTSGEGAE